MSEFYAFVFSEEEYAELKLALDHYKGHLEILIGAPFVYGAVEVKLRFEHQLVTKMLERVRNNPVVIDLDDMERRSQQ